MDGPTKLRKPSFENFHVRDITLVLIFFPLIKHILIYRVVLRYIFEMIDFSSKFIDFWWKNTGKNIRKFPSRTEFTSAVNNSPKRWKSPFSNKFFRSMISKEYSSVKSFFNQFKLYALILLTTNENLDVFGLSEPSVKKLTCLGIPSLKTYLSSRLEEFWLVPSWKIIVQWRVKIHGPIRTFLCKNWLG